MVFDLKENAAKLGLIFPVIERPELIHLGQCIIRTFMTMENF